MALSKKKSKNKAKADAHVGQIAKDKVVKKRQIQNAVSIKESKRKAAAITGHSSGRHAVDKDEDLVDAISSVDALFASEAFGTDPDNDKPERAGDDDGASDDSDSSAGAFHDVGDGDGDDDGLPPEDLAALDDEEGGAGARHEDEMKQLREKDPEFYKFLVENDKSLLEFRAPPEEVAVSGDEAGEEGKPEKEEPPEAKLMTIERFQRLRESAQTSFTAFKACLNCYHTAVRSIEEAAPEEDEDEDDQPTGKRKKKKKGTANRKRDQRGLLRIDNEATFSEVLEWSIANMLGLLQHYAGDLEAAPAPAKKGKRREKGLAAGSGKSQDAAAKVLDPTRFTRWRRVKVLAQIFWEETLFLLNHLVAPQTMEVVLRSASTPEALSWLWPFKSLRQRYFRRCCDLWGVGNSSQSGRLLAFLFIRNCATMAIHAPVEHERDVPPLETMTRAVLKAFADAASRGYSWRSLNTFRFMENCIVELLRLDKASAYRIGYAWIRQLALILRSSSISTSQGASEKNKKKGKGKQPLHALVGWPFVRAVYLWTRAVGAVPALKPLAYPLSMIVIGAVKSKITSLQHFPFVCHCLRNLNRLGSSLETFVPVSSHLLKVFSVMLASMEKSHRKGSGGGQTGGPSKAPDLEVLLRFRDGQVSETLSMEAVGGSLCFLLTDHLGLLSQSPAFPEISAPVLMHLKRYSKHCPSESLRRQLKSILTSAETSAEDVRARRDSLNDAPSWKKFLVFEADTALAKARTDALRRVASEEQARVQAEREQGGGAGHADGATKDERVKKHEEDAGKSKRALKRARVKNQKQEEQQEQERLESDALAKPKGKKRRKNTVAALPDKDVVEEMDFSSGEGE